MFDANPYRVELRQRIDVIRRLLDVSHPSLAPVPALDIGREVRGICVVLLFASYENLLTTLCRGLLEAAVRLRVGNRRFRHGLKLFAVFGELQAIANSKETQIWKAHGLRMVERLDQSRGCSINVDLFPKDGSFMKSSQVSLFCKLFSLGDPGPVLKEVWSKLDGVVAQRNSIAHGAATPEVVGRAYSIGDLRALVNSWESRWLEFLAHVEVRAGTREFYRFRR